MYFPPPPRPEHVPPREPPSAEPEPAARDSPRRARRVRIRSVLVAVLALGLLAFGAWAAIGPRTGGLPNTNNVHSVDVEFWPWGEDGVMAPGGSSSDPEAVAALVAVIRSAEETRDHKCGSRGVITLRRSL